MCKKIIASNCTLIFMNTYICVARKQNKQAYINPLAHVDCVIKMSSEPSIF